MRTSAWASLLIALAWPSVASAATEPNTLVNPLVPASACANCHNPPNAEIHAGDTPYAPITTWQSSMMGNSARDPVFWAAVAIASQDQAMMGVEVFETELCVRCHAPRAFLEGRGASISIDELQPSDRAGVECELCHRMQLDMAGLAVIGNAQYTIDDTIVNGIVPRRGPWTYEAADPYPPPHSWINDPSIGSSQLCGTCHDVTTPRERVDDDGNPLGVLFNEQRTYSEWASSDYANDPDTFRSCQDCHMPAVDDMAACTANTNMTSHPTGGRRHELAGANAFMMDVLDHLYGDGGTAEVPSSSYAETRAAIESVLATAATLELEPPDGVDLGAGLVDLGVRVTNNTGHKLPTGYSEGRVMWLELTASYGNEVLFSSGSPEQLTGAVADPVLRTYRAIAEQYGTGVTNHLLLSNHWVEDTRIPPLGLTQSIFTDPVGDRYEVLMDGNWPNYDAFAYDFDGLPDVVDATPEDPDNDVLDVQVRLLYIVNTEEYMDFLADTNATNEAGVTIANLFDELGGSPAMELAIANVSIPITSFGPVDGTSSGSASSGEEEEGSASGGPGTSNETSTGPTSGNTAPTSSPTGSGGGTSGDTDTDTDGGGGAEGDNGCGCRSTGTPGATAFLSVLLLAWRRRERTRLSST